jgi:hypothetical protein
MSPGDVSFWKHVFPISVIGVAGVIDHLLYCEYLHVLFCAGEYQEFVCGMVNTAFQIGSGVGLALSSAVAEAVAVKKQYETGLWCCVGLAGVGFVVSAVGVKSQGPLKGEGMAIH